MIQAISASLAPLASMIGSRSVEPEVSPKTQDWPRQSREESNENIGRFIVRGEGVEPDQDEIRQELSSMPLHW